MRSIKNLKDLLNNHFPASRREVQRTMATRIASHADILSEHPLLRRRLLKGLIAGSVMMTAGRLFLHEDELPPEEAESPTRSFIDDAANAPVTETAASVPDIDTALIADNDGVKDYLYKMRNFNADHSGDRFLDADDLTLLRQVTTRLERAQSVIGHANFNILGFDKLYTYSRNYSRIGAFTRKELDLMDRFFYTDARELGFYGDKVLDRLTLNIKQRDTIKIAHSGNFLFKGKPEQLLKKIQKQGGSDVILTSGIRGVVKQMHLFMEKTIASHGNLSLASRSLAPPGYSFHGISDFDVGQRGLGYRNFTADFASSDVYKKLSDLGYLTMRYPLDNMLGVRYEPWHVKVA